DHAGGSGQGPGNEALPPLERLQELGAGPELRAAPHAMRQAVVPPQGASRPGPEVDQGSFRKTGRRRPGEMMKVKSFRPPSGIIGPTMSQEIKARVHRRLIDTMDLAEARRMPMDQLHG